MSATGRHSELDGACSLCFLDLLPSKPPAQWKMMSKFRAGFVHFVVTVLLVRPLRNHQPPTPHRHSRRHLSIQSDWQLSPTIIVYKIILLETKISKSSKGRIWTKSALHNDKGRNEETCRYLRGQDHHNKLMSWIKTKNILNPLVGRTMVCKFIHFKSFLSEGKLLDLALFCCNKILDLHGVGEARNNDLGG